MQNSSFASKFHCIVKFWCPWEILSNAHAYNNAHICMNTHAHSNDHTCSNALSHISTHAHSGAHSHSNTHFHRSRASKAQFLPAFAANFGPELSLQHPNAHIYLSKSLKWAMPCLNLWGCLQMGFPRSGWYREDCWLHQRMSSLPSVLLSSVSLCQKTKSGGSEILKLGIPHWNASTQDHRSQAPHRIQVSGRSRKGEWASS